MLALLFLSSRAKTRLGLQEVTSVLVGKLRSEAKLLVGVFLHTEAKNFYPNHWETSSIFVKVQHCPFVEEHQS